MKQFILLFVGCVILSGCGAPVFMSEARRFQESPEILEALRPYLAEWANKSPQDTEEERREIGTQVNAGIGVGYGPPTIDGQSYHSVVIALDGLGEWGRGYLYTHEDVELQETEQWRFRQVEEHIYIYNFYE
jgi:hypothetical protein